MEERLRKVQKGAVDFWNKYDKRQRMLVLSIVATILITVVIMAVVLMKPAYVTLVEATPENITDVRTALDDGGVHYTTDGMTVKVKEEDLANATVLIGAKNIQSKAFYTLNDATNNGFSTTETDREKKYKGYLEDKMRSDLEDMGWISSAAVTITQPVNKFGVLNSKEETKVSVILTLKSEPSADAAENLARYVATAVGNPTTSNVTIIDSNSNLLFMGEPEEAGKGATSPTKQAVVKEKADTETKAKIRELFTALNFPDVVVAPSLVINYDVVNEVDTRYYVDDGREEGPLNSEYLVNQTGSNSSGGIPGTDPNSDDTTYEFPSIDGSENTYEMSKRDFAVNSTITTREGAVGEIDREKSSITVIANSYVLHNEDTMRANGELAGITFEQYRAQNTGSVPINVDPNFQTAVAKATGFTENNITILAYEIPMFQPSEGGTSRGFVQTYFPIALALLIFGLLGFVLWRTLAPVEITEVDTELSVEALLASTREAQPVVEDIDLNDKSETRKAVEKFIDENPEAVAMLLRNWLNEGWQ